MDHKLVSDAVSENRADETSAMFNMMMDEQRKLQGLFDVDHTIPKDDKEGGTLEKKSKVPKSTDTGKRDKRSHNKTSRSKTASGDTSKSDPTDAKVEAEVVVEKAVQDTEKANLTLPVPLHLPEGAAVEIVSKANGPVRVIHHHPVTSKTNASSKHHRDFTDGSGSGHNSLRPQSPSLRPQSPILRPQSPSLRPQSPILCPQSPTLGAECLAIKSPEEGAKSKIPTLKRSPRLDIDIDNAERSESKPLCEREHKPPDKPPRSKPLRPSTLQYRKTTNTDTASMRRTTTAYVNKATGAIPKYTGYSPLIAPRAVPETLSSTDPTPDSMQTSLLTVLEEKRKQSRSKADSEVLKEDKVSENMAMLEAQISQIHCKEKDASARPLLIRYLSEPEHEDSGASQSSITASSHTHYPGSGPLVPSNRPLVSENTAMPKTDAGLLSSTSGNTVAHPKSTLTTDNLCQQTSNNSPGRGSRTRHSPVMGRLDNEILRQDSNGNTMEDFTDEVFSHSDHILCSSHVGGNVLPRQPRARTRSPLNSSSTDDSPVHGSPRHKRFPNINIQRKTMQMPIATVESYSEDDEDDDYYPRKPLISSYGQNSANCHTATQPRTSIGNGTRTTTAVKLKSDKRKASRDSSKKYSKNGIYTAIPDNNLRVEPGRDSSDSLVGETSTSSMKAGEGSLERLTNKARVHPMDLSKGDDDQQNASNGSAKTSSRIPRPSSRLSRFQVFNLLQHDSDKTVKSSSATSPTQKMGRQQILLMKKYEQKRKHLTWRKGLSHLLGRCKPTTTNNNVTVASKTKASNGTARNSISQQHKSQQDKFTEMDKKWTSPPSPTQANTWNSMTVSSSPVPSNSASPAHQMFDISVSRGSTPTSTPQRKPPRKVGWAGCKECAKSDQSSDEGVDTSYTLERKVSATIVMQSLGASTYVSESSKLSSRQATTQT